MADTLITNFRDLPTVFDEAPAEAHRLAAYLGRIIQAATAWTTPGVIRQTALPCRNGSLKRLCTGRIRVYRSDVPREIRWDCPVCTEQGIISNWAGCDEDLSEFTRDEREQDLREILLTAVGYELLLDLDFSGCQRLIHGAAIEDGEIVLRGDNGEFDNFSGWLAGEANHAKPGKRQRLLDSMYESVQAVL